MFLNAWLLLGPAACGPSLQTSCWYHTMFVYLTWNYYQHLKFGRFHVSIQISGFLGEQGQGSKTRKHWNLCSHIPTVIWSLKIALWLEWMYLRLPVSTTPCYLTPHPLHSFMFISGPCEHCCCDHPVEFFFISQALSVFLGSFETMMKVLDSLPPSMFTVVLTYCIVLCSFTKFINHLVIDVT